ncbi:hypothetical protein CRENBAI_014134, partial [Crenichthys baileyi]
FPTWALKSPSRIMESPGGALSSTPDRDTKKAGYSALPLGPVGQNNSQRPIPDPKAQDATLSSTGVNPNMRRLSWGQQANPPQPAASPPWATPELEESPAPLKEMGSRAMLCVEASPTISSRYLSTSTHKLRLLPPSEEKHSTSLKASLSIPGSGS